MRFSLALNGKNLVELCLTRSFPACFMKRYKYKRLFFLVIFSLLAVSGFSQANQIIAKVNNEAITSDDLERYLQMIGNKINNRNEEAGQEKLEKEALNRLIEDRLILQQAKKENIEAPQDWLENKVKQLLSTYPDQESFEASLKKEGLTMSYLKTSLREQYLMREAIDRNIKAKVSVVPGQISRYYAENKKDFQSPPKAIFFLAKGKDEQGLENIADFIQKEGVEAAADKYKGQLLELDTYLSQIQEPLAETLESLEDGKLRIKEINGSYYLIYRKRIEPPRPLTLSEVQERIYKHLWQEGFSKRFNQWVESLKEDAVIKIYPATAPKAN